MGGRKREGCVNDIEYTSGLNYNCRMRTSDRSANGGALLPPRVPLVWFCPHMVQNGSPQIQEVFIGNTSWQIGRFRELCCVIRYSCLLIEADNRE